MTTTARTARRRSTSADLFQPIWRLLTSVRFALFFIGSLSIFGMLGVLIPQVPEAMRGNDAAVAGFVASKEDTFGPFTEPMYRLGLFSVFQARWFLFALGFLVVNVTTCTFNRWSPTFRNVFRPPERVPDTFFERAHNRTTFTPVSADHAAATLRRLRFGVKTREENGATYIFADRYPWAQLATFVSHLALILFIAGGLVTSLTGFTRQILAADGTTTPIFAVKDPNQLQVRIDDAIGAFGERGNALDFRTRITLFRNGEEVKSGTTTVNNPLEYGGYRFHQVAFFNDGAELRVRDTVTGNTVFNETFALMSTIAAPVVTISDGAGSVLVSDTIAPTNFLEVASGALVGVPGTSGAIWIGITAKDEDAWELIVFDPRESAGDGQLRVDEGAVGVIGGLRVRFDSVAAIPSALGLGVPGVDGQVLAQLTETDGEPALLLVGDDLPAISLAPGEPATVGRYEYIFEGQRDFAGISVKRDSGAWFIWVATGMLLTGLAVTFYVPRRRLWMKLTRDGTHVASLAEKSGGFEKDMRILATRLGVAVPPEMQEER